jgi:hypothetical protein
MRYLTVVVLLLLSSSHLFAASQSTYQVVMDGKFCEESKMSQSLECDYKIGQ